jgi:hypothetical protein
MRKVRADEFGHAPLKRAQRPQANRPVDWVWNRCEPLPVADVDKSASESGHAKAAREGLASSRLFGLVSLRPRRFLSALRHPCIVFRCAPPRRGICRQAAHPIRHIRDMFARRSAARAG